MPNTDSIPNHHWLVHTLLSKKRISQFQEPPKCIKYQCKPFVTEFWARLTLIVTTGRAPVLSLEEEAKLISHLIEVAKLGYGYRRQEVVDIASDYEYGLGKGPMDKPLTLNWFVKFAGRWPEILVVKPRALEIQRAKSTSNEVVESHFAELEKILIKYNLKDKPHLIFNVDEKGITQDHKPPSIFAGTDYHPRHRQS